MTAAEIGDGAIDDYKYLWRNNRGKAGRVRYGIPTPPANRNEEDWELKGGDHIGFRQVTITPDMVGQVIAQFVNVEEKAPGDTLMDGQRRWHNLVIEKGGLSEIRYGRKSGEIDIVREIIEE